MKMEKQDEEEKDAAACGGMENEMFASTKTEIRGEKKSREEIKQCR